MTDHDHDHGHDHHHDHNHEMLPQEAKVQLTQIFDALPKEVPLYLFTSKDDPPDEVGLARELGTAFAETSPMIRFKEFDITDKRAKPWGVRRTPTFLFAPDEYNIRYLGIPLGEEGRTLVETLILVGLRRSKLGEAAAGVMARLDSPRTVRVFVSPTCPYCPQQAVNAIKAGIERPDLVTVEIVDTAYNNDLAELYQAYSVPQTWANDIRIAEGAQAEELFVASMEKLEEQTFFIPSTDAERIETDLVIVGGGPAGLTAAIYAARSGLNAVVVEKGELGGQVATTPVVENYPGLSQIGGKNLVDIMVRHALEYVNIFPKEAVMEIEPGESIEVTTSLRKFTTRAVLLATGASHRKLGVPGEERFSGRGVSYCGTCDGPLFKDKKVFVVGGGDSAVTEALHLNHIGVDVSLVHRRDSLRAQEHLVRELDHHKIPILWNSEIKGILGEKKVEEIVMHNRETGESQNLPADGVFVSIGYDPEVSLAQMVGAEVGPDGYILHDGRHRTKVRGVYTAGDVEGGYKQIVTAAGAGAAAAMTLFEDLTHPYWEDETRHAKLG